jgi:hypothetical protein
MTNELMGVEPIPQETYEAMSGAEKIGWTSVTVSATKVMYVPKGFLAIADGRYVPTKSHTTIATTCRIYKQRN